MEIPLEIMFEIFVRLPIKSLIRFMCISKFCNSLIVSNSVFKDIYQCRSMTHPTFLVREWGSVYTAEQKEDGKVSIRSEGFFDKLFTGCSKFVPCLMCVNGLFCLWTEFTQPVVICNPSTREVRFLPQLNDQYVNSEYVMFLLGFDPEEKMYKLLMSAKSDLVKAGSTRNWVFTLGIDESWRETKTTADICLFIDDEICINGVIYQLNYNTCYSGWNIIAFDVKDENFRIIELWISPLNNPELNNNYMLTEVKGKLAVIDYGEEFGSDMDLWILGKTQGGWERHIIAFPLLWKERLFEKISFCFRTHYEGEIVFAANMKKTNEISYKMHRTCRVHTESGEGQLGAQINELSYFCYDVTRKCWREFESQGLPADASIHRIYVYAESLFSLFKFSNSLHHV